MAERTGKNLAPRVKVWVLLYSHRYGNDLFAFSSEDRAYAAAVKVAVIEWMHRIDPTDNADVIKEVKDFIAARDHKMALAVWQDWWHGGGESPETIDIELLDVQ